MLHNTARPCDLHIPAICNAADEHVSYGGPVLGSLKNFKTGLCEIVQLLRHRDDSIRKQIYFRFIASGYEVCAFAIASRRRYTERNPFVEGIFQQIVERRRLSGIFCHADNRQGPIFCFQQLH